MHIQPDRTQMLLLAFRNIRRIFFFYEEYYIIYLFIYLHSIHFLLFSVLKITHFMFIIFLF